MNKAVPILSVTPLTRDLCQQGRVRQFPLWGAQSTLMMLQTPSNKIKDVCKVFQLKFLISTILKPNSSVAQFIQSKTTTTLTTSNKISPLFHPPPIKPPKFQVAYPYQ
jgi:hypothetical protein